MGSLGHLTDDELYTKLNELNKRYSQAYRFGPFQVLPQLQMLIDDYNAEISRRNAQKMQELQDKLEKRAKKEKDGKDGKGLKGIIDIQ